MKKAFCFLICLLVLCCINAIGEGQLTTFSLDPLNPTSDFASPTVVDLTFTAREDQSPQPDPAIRLYYCLYAADRLYPGIAVAAFEQELAETNIYYLRKETGADHNGQPCTDLFFCDTLVLRLLGDPVEAAQLVASCPQHAGQTQTVDIELGLSNQALFQKQSYEPVVSFAADSLSAQETRADYQQQVEAFLQSSCMHEPHSADDRTLLVPWMYMNHLQLLYAGMPQEQVEWLLENHAVSGSTITTGREEMLADYDPSGFDRFDDAAYIQCTHQLYAGSHMGTGFVFAEGRLCYATLVITSPLCPDLCAYDIGMLPIRSIDRSQIVPHNMEMLKRGVFIALSAPK